MNVLSLLAPHFEHYITLDRVHPSQTYDYKAREFFGLPVIDITMHQAKCRPDSWLYVAVAGGTRLATLEADAKLYVGSQTADRMFRGDGMGGLNFHHAQMRAGNGNDNSINYLRTGKKVDIYRISSANIGTAVREIPALRSLASLLTQPTKHVGYWFEQFCLYADRHSWRWNTAGADAGAQAIIRSL